MACRFFEDSLQQSGKHDIKHDWWLAHNVQWTRTRFDGKHGVPVDFGDYYYEDSNVVVDTKRNIQEIASNINGRDHRRFREECKRAQRDGYRLIVLIENRDGITDLESLKQWTNEHCQPCGYYKRNTCDPHNGIGKCLRHGTRKLIQGERLAVAMRTMSERYGVRFEFCTPHESAKIICDKLGVTYEQDAAGSAETTRAGIRDTPDKA